MLFELCLGPILESKGMHAVFWKKGKNIFRKGKVFKNLGKIVQNLKVFWKRAGDCMQLLEAMNCYNRPCYLFLLVHFIFAFQEINMKFV